MIKKKQLCYVHVILFFGCEEEVEKIIEEDDYIIIILSPTLVRSPFHIKKNGRNNCNTARTKPIIIVCLKQEIVR